MDLSALLGRLFYRKCDSFSLKLMSFTVALAPAAHVHETCPVKLGARDTFNENEETSFFLSNLFTKKVDSNDRSKTAILFAFLQKEQILFVHHLCS